jgi:hypothetical protein
MPGNIYSKFNRKPLTAREKLHNEILKFMPMYPRTQHRGALLITYMQRGVDMLLIRSALASLRRYGMISRVVYRWQMEETDEFLCLNPDYPNRMNVNLFVDDMCPKWYRYYRGGKKKAPEEWEKRKDKLLKRGWTRSRSWDRR